MKYQKRILKWGGIDIEVKLCPQWIKTSIIEVAHIQIQSQGPNPLTETGHTNYYIQDQPITLSEACTHILSLLNEKGGSQQLSLF